MAATQVFDIYPTPRKWLAPKRIPNLENRYVKPDWILITCSGMVGTSIMTYSAHDNLVISHDLLRIEVKERKLRNYVYTFLRTSFGRAMLRSSQYGSVIKHLEVSHLADLPVPIVDHLLGPLSMQVGQTFRMRNEAYSLDQTCRLKLDEALHDRPKQTLNEEGFVVPAALLFGGRRRLEAYPYNPTSQFVTQVYEHNAESVDCLGEIADVLARGRFKHIYGENGTPYLDSEPIFKVNPELTKFLTPATRIDFDSYFVKKGWLLMACSGQIYGINGQATLATEWHEGKVVSDHILRIIPDTKKVRSGYLQAVVSHPTLGQPLVVSRAYGTSVPELAPKDIEALPIPRLAPEVENDIADSAEQASELRRKADEMENRAVANLENELNNQGVGFSC